MLIFTYICIAIGVLLVFGGIVAIFVALNQLANDMDRIQEEKAEKGLKARGYDKDKEKNNNEENVN